MLTGEPFIPETVTVHLGAPDANAENVTVSFLDYLKNVASSEIYPTWPENALRANLYVITTFVLNRIYTEWYRSRGYPFDITSSTSYDQAFVYGREIFENISRLVDTLFPYYVRRQGYVEPLFTSFCNGTTVTCSGLSQWGTVTLAEQGKTPYEILQYYYGEDIDIVRSTDIRSGTPTFPGEPLSLGDAGDAVQTIQVQLNRISRNYPAIPKIANTDGIFGEETDAAVRMFQSIFNLPDTGIVDEATWYKASYLYTSVKRLSELSSEGLTAGEIARDDPSTLRPGTSGELVRSFQYFLAVVGAYYASVTPLTITGVYDAATTESVRSFQQTFGLPQTGVVDRQTWTDIFAAYQGILDTQPPDACAPLFPNRILREGMTDANVRILQQSLTALSQVSDAIPSVSDTGYFGPLTKASVQAFQRTYGLTPNGVVGAITWDAIAGAVSELRCGSDKRPYQAPGYTITAQPAGA